MKTLFRKYFLLELKTDFFKENFIITRNSWSFFDPFYFYFDCQSKNKTRENI